MTDKQLSKESLSGPHGPDGQFRGSPYLTQRLHILSAIACFACIWSSSYLYGMSSVERRILPTSDRTPPTRSWNKTNKLPWEDVRKKIRSNFDDSGIATFLRTYDDVVQKQEKQLVLICGPRGCGGIADRVRALPYAVSLALLSGRQLVVHSTILSGALPIEGYSSDIYYHFIDAHCTTENLHSILKNDAPLLYVGCNCYSFGSSFSDYPAPVNATIESIWKECQMPLNYLCGAAIMHRLDHFEGDLADGYQVAQSISYVSERKYDVIHIRAGGSTLRIGNESLEAVPWQDGHATQRVQYWINAFRTSNFSNCERNIAVVSDSSRVLSEIRFAVNDRIMVVNCCVQPLHRDRTNRKESFSQEIIDLFIMARSRKIYSVIGGFSFLGQYWLGKNGPNLVTTATPVQVKDAIYEILVESGCKNIAVSEKDIAYV